MPAQWQHKTVVQLQLQMSQLSISSMASTNHRAPEYTIVQVFAQLQLDDVFHVKQFLAFVLGISFLAVFLASYEECV